MMVLIVWFDTDRSPLAIGIVNLSGVIKLLRSFIFSDVKVKTAEFSTFH